MQTLKYCLENINHVSLAQKTLTKRKKLFIFEHERTYDKNITTSYRGADCMQIFSNTIKILAMTAFNTQKKKMIPLTDKEKHSYEKHKYCHICRKKFIDDEEDKRYKNYRKVRDHDHYTGKFRGAAHSICNLRYKIPKEFPVVFHNGAKYDYHFIIKELVRKMDDNMDCLGEEAEKYITFKVPLKKENKNGSLTTYKLKFIDSYRFMNTSLSNLTDNLSEINKQECKKCKINCNYITHKNEVLIYKCKECNNKSCKSITPLKEKFSNIYNLANNDNNKFILLLKKGVYPYDYMDSWGKFNENLLPLKKKFYNNLYQEDITKEDYKHAQKVWSTFSINNLGEYHDLYVQSDTLLLADIFENFRDTCTKIYQLDPTHFLSAPGLAWQTCLKKANVKLELLTDINMLLMVEQGIRGGICQAVHRYATANNKYMKNYNRNVMSSYL